MDIQPAEESAYVQKLLTELKPLRAHEQAIAARARRYIETLRASGKRSALESFQSSYNLSSHEGVMIMCLAEALLRIPDGQTADALIHDKLGAGEWDSHIGLGRPLGLSAASLGLEVANKISDASWLRETAGSFIGGLIHRLGEPVVRASLRQAMKLMGSVFVFGETIKEASAKTPSFHAQGYRFSFDMLGEGARSAAQAEGYFTAYRSAVAALKSQEGKTLLARDGVSIKLTALHPRIELRQWERLEKELLPPLIALVREAALADIPLTIDAEEATRLNVTLKIFKALAEAKEFAGYQGLGLAVQAYNTRATEVIASVGALARATSRRIPVRLVKGAYWDGEIKRAQADALADYPVFTRKAHTDLSYLACAQQLLADEKSFYPQFATHNALTIASILEIAQGREFEFQRLQGMGETLYETVLQETKLPCRIYAPVGPASHLLSYLIRRILENGANSSFVHGMYDAPLDSLLTSPLAVCETDQGAPAISIPKPYAVYPGRQTLKGRDAGDEETLALWRKAGEMKLSDAPALTLVQDVDGLMQKAKRAQVKWSETPVAARATMLENLAERYEAHRDELIGLCINEAGKTFFDALSEVREAIDYCLYYALEVRRALAPLAMPAISGERNMLSLTPRGVAICISPWNFPLAIFTGQIVAALVTGNAVIAKPAEETPRIAGLAIRLMHEAGIPADALQAVYGAGETVGAALVAHNDGDVVAFTGSTRAAYAIHRSMAARDRAIAPLIAETGGQNCMVVDSSALLEQAVDDIIISAFGSAGQRCSSLRVLFVQQEIADKLIALLTGAMQQLNVGRPQDPATDIGPVISPAARDLLQDHITHMKSQAKFLASAPIRESMPNLVAPHLFEIPSIAILKGEVFGPILHLVRYRAEAINDVIAQINSTGFGLTFGVESRIDARINLLCERVQAGNIYVNRAMTGAVVGAQPFGGMGLSGTGPKAGGPHYLARFCNEKTVTVNSAAIGGNLELLVGKA